MNHYHHLTLSEREKTFFALRNILFPLSKELGRKKSTISRELKRNSLNRDYWPVDAQAAYCYQFVLENCNHFSYKVPPHNLNVGVQIMRGLFIVKSVE